MRILIPIARKARAAKYNIPNTYVDYKEMIDKEDVEAVSVLTWNQAHAAPTIYALEAGKHVLVEKPMAATLDDAVAIAKAAKATDKLLMVGLKARYDDTRIAAQTMVDSGVLGDIYYGESGGFGRLGLPGGSFIAKETAGIGVVGDWGVYSLDATLCLMGHPKPVAVSGVANNFLGRSYSPIFGARHHGGDFDPERLTVEDFGAAWVRFDTGAVVTFKAAWISHLSGGGSPFLLGTDAGLKLHPLTLYRWEFGMLTDTEPMNVRPTDGLEQFRRENYRLCRCHRERQALAHSGGGDAVDQRHHAGVGRLGRRGPRDRSERARDLVIGSAAIWSKSVRSRPAICGRASTTRSMPHGTI